MMFIGLTFEILFIGGIAMFVFAMLILIVCSLSLKSFSIGWNSVVCLGSGVLAVAVIFFVHHWLEMDQSQMYGNPSVRTALGTAAFGTGCLTGSVIVCVISLILRLYKTRVSKRGRSGSVATRFMRSV